MTAFVRRLRASARTVAHIVRKELLQVRQDRRMLGISLVAPVLQVLVLGYTATTDIKYSMMVVRDQDRTAESREFIRAFTTSGYFVHASSVDRDADVDRSIERGDASVALVIPRDFGRDLMTGGSPQVQMIFDGSDANTANVLLSYATQIVASYAAGAARPGAVRLQPQGTRPGAIMPEPRVWFNPDLKSSNFMVPGVVALVLMIITMTLTSLAIVKEKEIGTLEQLLVTPIQPYELILGKLIPFVLIGVVDVVVVLALAHYWFEVPMVGSLPLLFGLSGLFILTTLGLGLFISTIARSQQQAMLIAQFFFFMPFIYLSGFAFPISNMPEAIQYVTYLIPLRYFLEIVRGVFLKGAGFGELWPQAAALFLLGGAILTLAVARFRETIE
jgi:ABC-2 type transport system permease protein